MTFFRPSALAAALVILLPCGLAAQPSDDAEALDTALSLAVMLQSARGVIGSHQDLINDPDLGDKGLSGASVLDEAIAAYIERTGEDPRTLPDDSQRSALLRAQMGAISQVIEENRATIDREGVGFKGFVPAVFARLVNESFSEAVGGEARIKVTAPENLVRNRRARPDPWELDVIERHLSSPDWPTGEVFHGAASLDDRGAYRVLVPEYYSEACLVCHGGPAGEIDITGYPMEGGALGDLGGVISITLFDQD